MKQVANNVIINAAIIDEKEEEVWVMGRPKKNGTYLNVRIETSIYQRLENLCDDAGQTKTVAVERALLAYFEDYEEQQRELKKLRNEK